MIQHPDIVFDIVLTRQSRLLLLFSLKALCTLKNSNLQQKRVSQSLGYLLKDKSRKSEKVNHQRRGVAGSRFDFRYLFQGMSQLNQRNTAHPGRRKKPVPRPRRPKARVVGEDASVPKPVTSTMTYMDYLDISELIKAYLKDADPQRRTAQWICFALIEKYPALEYQNTVNYIHFRTFWPW